MDIKMCFHYICASYYKVKEKNVFILSVQPSTSPQPGGWGPLLYRNRFLLKIMNKIQ